MNRGWTPKTDVAITEAGMVIKMEMEGVHWTDVRVRCDSDQLCISGTHKNLGAFEIRIHVPPGYNVAKLKYTFLKGGLRIDLPPGTDKPFFTDYPKNMLIYCDGCGKHFDIVVAGKGPADYQCPACGKVQTFDLEALINKVIEQSKNVLRRKRGRR